MTKTATEVKCHGVTALGDCSNKPIYLLVPAPIRRKSDYRHSCGVHMAQMVKRMIPHWGLVAVGELR